MSKEEILQRVSDLLQSSFIDDNYDETNIHKLFDDSLEYVMEEFEDYGIEYNKEEIIKYLSKKI